MSEPRRYFPDWTRCPFASGRELEADHNSYFAGGYAEEFGYMATDEWSRGVPVLDGPPDRYRKKRGQAHMTHPGYPLRPHPLTGGIHGILSIHRLKLRKRAAQPENLSNLVNHGDYITVHTRSMNGKQGSAAERVAKRTIVRLASSLVSLRWALRRRAMLQERR